MNDEGIEEVEELVKETDYECDMIEGECTDVEMKE